ncbi:substrate-binding domain-containing protein [Muriicola marianensis]|uniref:ABC transporter substrate-binding protein n=1 Tax=Muriicola marianensis TaxID=1324801 RepID=A0ABQ1QPC0_9FLAO|nr:substrate-binding domain-containing protein [Muriicola marianensis]GGD39409.1 ABC transporter substrate-binding protein [Muriicola marianensis]
MKEFRIIGVPEHFNLPWHMALEEGAFADRGIDLRWQDVPEGTGKMCAMLEAGEADMAVVLTEGVVRRIAEKAPLTIIQGYVNTPLQWGIHVADSSRYRDIAQLEGTKAAISRFGSGSHLMAYVMARNEGWNTAHLSFEVVNTLEGAVKALQEGTADYFMWEHFTTKPLVDEGVFRRLGDCPTPWPCFVLAVPRDTLIENRRLIGHILEVINTYTADFKRIPSIDRTLANRYELNLNDVNAWLGMTSWTQEQISDQVVEKVSATLLDLQLISKAVSLAEVLTRL